MLPSIAQLYLRLSIGSAFAWFGLDRLGAWGPFGKPWISWGDWAHFSTYAHQLMFFLPYRLASIFAAIATAIEISCGLLLILGLFTRWAAFAGFGLALCFALAMSIANGITSPLGYSVFTVSAACLMLAVQPDYHWSVDNLKQTASNRKILPS